MIVGVMIGAVVGTIAGMAIVSGTVAISSKKGIYNKIATNRNNRVISKSYTKLSELHEEDGSRAVDQPRKRILKRVYRLDKNNLKRKYLTVNEQVESMYVPSEMGFPAIAMAARLSKQQKEIKLAKLAKKKLQLKYYGKTTKTSKQIKRIDNSVKRKENKIAKLGVDNDVLKTQGFIGDTTGYGASYTRSLVKGLDDIRNQIFCASKPVADVFGDFVNHFSNKKQGTSNKDVDKKMGIRRFRIDFPESSGIKPLKMVSSTQEIYYVGKAGIMKDVCSIEWPEEVADIRIVEQGVNDRVPHVVYCNKEQFKTIIRGYMDREYAPFVDKITSPIRDSLVTHDLLPSNVYEVIDLVDAPTTTSSYDTLLDVTL